MNVFHFMNYKEFVLLKIRSLPNQGKGEFSRIAKTLRLHTSVVSQIFRGPRELSPEHACTLARHLGMNELESEYFLCLVQHNRAESAEARKVMERQLSRLRKLTDQAREREHSGTALTEEQRAIFYSNWYYSGVRLLSMIPRNQDDVAGAAAKQLGIPPVIVEQVIEFLVSAGLCARDGDRIKPGPAITIVEAASPHINRHHVNWRLKAIERMAVKSPEELYFTVPMVISEHDKAKVREEVLSLMNRLKAIIPPSRSEKLCCLNMDLFDLT